MKKILSILILSVCLLPSFALAESEALGLLERAGDKGGYVVEGVTETTISERIGQVIMIFLGFLGLIFLILMISGGLKWMMAKGNEDEVEEAQKTIRAAIIGLIVTIAAYSLWTFLAFILL